MDEEDLESLLDAAFGIDSAHVDPASQPGCGKAPPEQQQQYDSSSSISPCPSPAASPVHTYPPTWVPSGSPCVSDVSVQMHHNAASPAHDSSIPAGEQQYEQHLLYSPIREGLSPAPEGVPAAPEPVASLQQQPQQQPQCSQAAAAPAGSPQAKPRQRSSSPSRPQQPRVSLGCLPHEVQMRVLSLLSADSLTSLAQTCSQFSGLCNEPVLWRRLCVHRFGKDVRHGNAQSWKVSGVQERQQVRMYLVEHSAGSTAPPLGWLSCLPFSSVRLCTDSHMYGSRAVVLQRLLYVVHGSPGSDLARCPVCCLCRCATWSVMQQSCRLLEQGPLTGTSCRTSFCR